MAPSKDIPAIFVVYGKNRRAVSEHIEDITQHVLGDSDRQVALTGFEGDNAVLADVLDELRTLPFLSERRLVIVRDADGFISSYREELESYLDHPSPTGILLLVPDSFPGNTRLAKKAKKIGKVISCEPVKAQHLPRYLIDYARRTHALTLVPDAAALLVELGGDDAGMLCGEVDKLAAYVADPETARKRIEVSDVQELVGNNRQFNVFNVIDAMTQGQPGLALKLLEQMLCQDRDAEYKAVGAFAWHFRRLYNGRRMLDQNIPERQVTQQLRVWPRPEAFLRQLKPLNLRTIGKCLQTLMHIDLVSKTGGGTVRTGLEKLIVDFCQGRMANV
jgi:DNA polymerase-3 subunit delta